MSPTRHYIRNQKKPKEKSAVRDAKNQVPLVPVRISSKKTLEYRAARFFLLGVLIFLIGSCFMLLWIMWADGQNMLQQEQGSTPQECSDRYFTMNLEERGWWDGPEDYINHCLD